MKKYKVPQVPHATTCFLLIFIFIESLCVWFNIQFIDLMQSVLLKYVTNGTSSMLIKNQITMTRKLKLQKYYIYIVQKHKLVHIYLHIF